MDDIINDESGNAADTEGSNNLLSSEKVDEVWQQALSIIKSTISKPSYDTWYKGTSAKIVNEKIVIFSPTHFSAEWLGSRYKNQIHQTLTQIIGEDIPKISFQSMR